MKRAKKWLACLLAGALALAVFTGCDMLMSGTAQKDTAQAKALMKEIDSGLTYNADLEEAACRVADWLVEDPTQQGTRSGLFMRKVPLTADSGNMTDTNVNDFIDHSSTWISIPQTVTIGLVMDNQSLAFTGYLYAPPLSEAASVLGEYAAGRTEMGAAFVEYSGETYVVALFR